MFAPGIQRTGRLWAAAIVIAAAARFSSPAYAELSAEDLTANAITGVGPYYQDVVDAIRQFTAGDFAAAMKFLESAKKSTPKLAPPEIMMARLYFDANQPNAGVIMLEKAIQRVPGDPEALVILGERAANEGRTTEAAMLFDKALKVMEKFSENARRKLNMQVRLYTSWYAVDEIASNWEEARRKMEELLKVDPRNASVHEKLGRALFRLGDQRAAFAEFQAAVESDKTKKMLPAELAMAVLSTDKVKAEQWMARAIKANPQDLRTQLGATEYLLRTNQLEQAQTHAEEALKLDPAGLDANMFVGVIARMAGDYKKAETHLSAAYLLAPTNRTIANNLALVLIELPDPASKERALQFAKINAREYPSDLDVIATFGWINFRLNHRLDAERAFQAVLNSGAVATSHKLSADMGYYMANLAKERGRTSDAIKMLKESLNTTEPFAYRKPAQEMLVEMIALEKTQGSKAKGLSTSKGSEPTGKTGKAEKADAAK